MKTCSFNVSDKRKDEITAKFQSTKRVPIEDTKRFMSPEKIRDFRETDPTRGCHVIAKLIFVAFNKRAEIPAN